MNTPTQDQATETTAETQSPSGDGLGGRTVGLGGTLVEGRVQASGMKHRGGYLERRVMLQLPGAGEYFMSPQFARQISEALKKGAEMADGLEMWEFD